MRTPGLIFRTLVSHAFVSRALAAVLLLAAAAPWAAADDSPHVRPTCAALRALVAEGIARSSTFRALVDQLDASDVVVYVEFKTFAESNLSGQTAFISTVDSRRYLQIYIAPLPKMQALAMLGHELRHAVEIADTPSVINRATFAHCYERIGYSVASHTDRFDTENAVDVGRRVFREALATSHAANGE